MELLNALLSSWGDLNPLQGCTTLLRSGGGWGGSYVSPLRSDLRVSIPKVTKTTFDLIWFSFKLSSNSIQIMWLVRLPMSHLFNNVTLKIASLWRGRMQSWSFSLFVSLFVQVLVIFIYTAKASLAAIEAKWKMVVWKVGTG